MQMTKEVQKTNSHILHYGEGREESELNIQESLFKTSLEELRAFDCTFEVFTNKIFSSNAIIHNYNCNLNFTSVFAHYINTHHKRCNLE